MKICVIISSHSPSVYTKLTIATLLRASKNNHDLNIHIGVHSNYSDYTSDFSLFNELKGIAQIHCVDEIDWMEHARNNYRYSLMHSKNIENLFKNIKYYDFDYLVILDNDVYIKSDFISLLTNNEITHDLIFNFFDKNVKTIDNERRPTGEYNATVQFAPKIACWNLMISRKLYNKIMEDTSIIYPDRVIDQSKIDYYKSYIPQIDSSYPIVFDTLSKVLFNSLYIWEDIKTLEVDTNDMSEMIRHFFCSSFNYGIGILNNTQGEGNVSKLYNSEFPKGIIK